MRSWLHHSIDSSFSLSARLPPEPRPHLCCRHMREKYSAKSGQWNRFVLVWRVTYLFHRGALVEPTRQVMPDPEIHVLVKRWRARAEELLAEAEKMLDRDARLTMQEIAAKYEVLAQRVEQQIRRTEEA